MRLITAKKDSYVVRGSDLTIRIYISKTGQPFYIGKDNRIASRVNRESTAYNYSDYIYSDQYGNIFSHSMPTGYPTTPTKKETQMEYQKLEVIVENSDGGTSYYETDDAAQDAIAEVLEAHPRMKFKVFTVSYEVQPQKVDLKDLIKKR